MRPTSVVMTSASAFLLMFTGVSLTAQTLTPEQTEICAEAEARYREMFGKPSKDEPVTVVTMYRHTFCPPYLTVKRGSTVRFVNVDRRTTHSFWFKDQGQPESERMFSGEKIEMKIDLPPGEHIYLCGPHWEQDKMIGKLKVEQ